MRMVVTQATMVMSVLMTVLVNVSLLVRTISISNYDDNGNAGHDGSSCELGKHPTSARPRVAK